MRSAGRVHPVFAAALALAICGALVYVLLTTGEPGRREDAPEVSAPELTAPLPPEGRESDIAPAAAPGPTETVREDAAAPAATAEEAASRYTEESRLRLHGTVTDDQGSPIAGAVVRWLPREDVRAFLHDPSLIRDAPERPLSLPSRLRAALAASVSTQALEDGSYELISGTGEPSGILVAWSPGREVGVRQLDDETPPKESETPEAVARAVETPAPRPATAADGSARVEQTAAGADGVPAAATPAGAPTRDLEVDFRLAAAGRVSGEVLLAGSGEPAAGMVVVAGQLDRGRPAFLQGSGGNDNPRAVVRSDGRYAIAGLRPGEYRVAPRTGESGAVTVPWAKARQVVLEAGVDVEGVDFTVEPGGKISGRVLDPEGAPVSAARCRLVPKDFMKEAMSGTADLFEREEKSDADGRFELRGAPLGRSYRVAVTAGELSPGVSDEVELTAAEPHAEVEVVLTPGFAISGHVLREDGSPAAGIDVRIVPDMGEMMSGSLASALVAGSTKSGDDGAFILERLPDGEHRLTAGELDPTAFFTGEQQEAMVVRVSGADVAGVRLVARDASSGSGAIAGIVVDDLGQPIEGASVRIQKRGGFAFLATKSVTTAAGGRFSAEGLAGDSFRVGASAPGHAPGEEQTAPVGTFELVLRLDRLARVSGTVLLSDPGAPFAGGQVQVKTAMERGGLAAVQALAAQLGEKTAEAEISPDGSFSIEAPPGKVEVLARVAGFAPGLSPPITLRPGEERRGVEVRLSRGAVIHGRVSAPGRASVEGARVAVRPMSDDDTDEAFRTFLPDFLRSDDSTAQSVAGGAFEVAFLPPGRYAVVASHPDFAPSEPVKTTVTVDEVKAVGAVLLRESATLVVRTLELDAPKAGAMVQLMQVGDLKQATTDADGVVEIGSLAPGEYRLNVMDMAAMGAGKWRLRSLAVTLEPGENSLDVVFGKGHAVRGKVEGLPPGGQKMITLRRPGGPAPESMDPTDVKASLEAQKYQAGVAFIRADGTFEMDDVDPGTYIAEVPRLPEDLTDFAAYKDMTDRTPLFRKEIEVKDGDVTLDIEIDSFPSD